MKLRNLIFHEALPYHPLFMKASKNFDLVEQTEVLLRLGWTLTHFLDSGCKIILESEPTDGLEFT